MPRRRRERESSSESDSSASEYGGPSQEPWLISQQERGGYKTLRSEMRRYDEWCGLDKHGETVRYPGNGGLFPEGYQPNWQQAKPFRCPIMGCRIACEHLHQVGSHFRAKHRKALLFDQRNGTFTVFDKKRVPTDKEYRDRRRKWAAVVVKRAPQPGWQAVQQAQQVQQVPVQQAAPAHVVQPPAALAPLPAGQPAHQPNSALQPAAAPAAQVGYVSPRRRGPRPPLAARRAGRQASAPAIVQPFPQLPLPGAPVRDAASSPIRRPQPPPLPLRELPAAAGNNRGNNGNQRNNGGTNIGNNSNRASDFTKPHNPSIWDYINTFTPEKLPLPLDSALMTLLSRPRVSALPKCWKHRLRTDSAFSPSPSPTPSPPPPIPSFYPPSNITRSGLAEAGALNAINAINTNNNNNDNNNNENNENNQPDSSGPLSLKDLSSLAAYLSRRESTTPCGSPHCLVGKLPRVRFNEVNKAFNLGSTTIHREMAFPKCKAIRVEDLTGDSEAARAMRERFGQFAGCVNAYWAHGEEVMVGEVLMEDA
ncbi:hypothetical protein SMAC4_13352 [Sordaria macrospora]|uniref:uncharacterized protein n=1 Tax=Sordaria macrospora TaxID=5147 RepID=UPI002B2D94E8|nr:hypothetical protein SMAC4_13352 [Sordaria macrospora]